MQQWTDDRGRLQEEPEEGAGVEGQVSRRRTGVCYGQFTPSSQIGMSFGRTGTYTAAMHGICNTNKFFTLMSEDGLYFTMTALLTSTSSS